MHSFLPQHHMGREQKGWNKDKEKHLYASLKIISLPQMPALVHANLMLSILTRMKWRQTLCVKGGICFFLFWKLRLLISFSLPAGSLWRKYIWKELHRVSVGVCLWMMCHCVLPTFCYLRSGPLYQPGAVLPRLPTILPLYASLQSEEPRLSQGFLEMLLLYGHSRKHWKSTLCKRTILFVN